MLKNKIAELETELSGLRGENSTMIEPLLQKFSKEDQDKVRAALKQAELNDSVQPPTEREIRLVQEAMMKLLPEEKIEQLLFGRRSSILGEVETILDLTPTQEKRLRKLNYCLRAAALKKLDAETGRRLWQCYMRCKDYLPPFTHLIPDEAWDILWMSQDGSSSGGQERATHLSVLANDMSKSGKQLTLHQSIVLINSLILESRHVEAMETWQRQQSLVAKDGELPVEYETLGVHLFSSQGDPRKAQEIALKIVAKGTEDMSNILVPVMQAWIRCPDENSGKNAWALYLHLKARMGPLIKAADYDKIILGFLHAGQKDLALAAFKDFMLTCEESKYESTELYKRSIGLVTTLQSNSIELSELTRVSLTALTVLPRKFQNKYFYGSWMKRLIGMGHPDAAAMVIELMYERGVKPDSKHLNGIMGAWLRLGTATDKEKAEKMGWAMIQERLDFVSRRSGSIVVTTDGIQDASDIRIPLHLQRTVSPATIETFSLLLLHYERRGKLKHIQLLRHYLYLAQIHPNTYFMNHLLYAELRRGQHAKSWELYKSLSPKVRSDLETFACLWDCQKVHMERLSVYPSDKFPGPRRIFYDMVSYYAALGAKARDDVKEEFSRDLYDQIIRCMCLAKDMKGTLVALYALRDCFQTFPDHNTARMVILQVASMGAGNASRTSRRRRSRLTDNTQAKANIARITKVFQLVSEQRAEVLQARGVKLDEAASREEQLYLLAEFLRVVLRMTDPDSEDFAVEKEIEKVAWEMGVGGIRILEPNTSV